MKKATIVLCLIILIVTGIAFFWLPEEIPMHYNAAGEIDRYGSRFEIFLLPIISLLITALSILFKKIDPKKEKYEHFIKSFWIVLFSINSIVLVILVMIISEAIHPGNLNVNTIMLVMMSIVFMVLGNIMPKIKANYFMGLRTPWTLASEEVWYKTHRFSGKIWFVGGILTLFALFIPSQFLLFFILAMSVLLALVPTIYSYICFKKIK